MIGNENLPNVYIDKVILRSDGFKTKVEVYLSMFDRVLRPLWYGRTKTAGLSIKVKVSDDSTEIEQLNKGNQSLFSFDPSSATKVLTTANGLEITLSELENMRKFQYYCEFSISREQINSLNVYAASFLDFDGFQDNKEMNKYYGPMTAEIVFEGGAIPESSKYFIYSDTEEEYAGPVHQHPTGGWMEGSVHSDRPHRSLTLIDEDNFKIIDNRD